MFLDIPVGYWLLYSENFIEIKKFYSFYDNYGTVNSTDRGFTDSGREFSDDSNDITVITVGGLLLFLWFELYQFFSLSDAEPW